MKSLPLTHCAGLAAVALLAGLNSSCGANRRPGSHQLAHECAENDRRPAGENAGARSRTPPSSWTSARSSISEKALSKNGTQSCNSCHAVDGGRAGVDNEPTSPGAFGKRGDRNSPTTLNAGFHLAQFWDGRAPDLKEQAKGPILNPVEMAMPAEPVVVERLKADKNYPQLFAAAFAGSSDPVNYENLAACDRGV